MGFVVRKHEGAIKAIEGAHKVYYCPLKWNRQATQGPEMPYQRLDTLPFDESEEQSGRIVHLKKFPKDHQVKLFGWFPLPETRNGSSPTIFLKLPFRSPQADSGTLEDRAVSPPMETTTEFNANAENKEPNAITSRPQLPAWAHLSSGSNADQNNGLRLKQGLLDDYPAKQLEN